METIYTVTINESITFLIKRAGANWYFVSFNGLNVTEHKSLADAKKNVTKRVSDYFKG